MIMTSVLYYLNYRDGTLIINMFKYNLAYTFRFAFNFADVFGS